MGTSEPPSIPPSGAALLRRLVRSGLYLVTDDRLPLEELLAKTRAALRAGVEVIQYRDKERPTRELLARGEALRDLCREHDAIFLVNDHLAVALALQAEGIHLGQDDMPAALARKLLPSGYLVGLSVHSLAESRAPDTLAADYLGIGAMYPTQTKVDAQHRGLALLREVRSDCRLPLVAIGGITADRAMEVIAAGADAVAVISSIYGAPDPGAAVGEFLANIARARQAR